MQLTVRCIHLAMEPGVHTHITRTQLVVLTHMHFAFRISIGLNPSQKCVEYDRTIYFYYKKDRILINLVENKANYLTHSKQSNEICVR